MRRGKPMLKKRSIRRPDGRFRRGHSRERYFSVPHGKSVGRSLRRRVWRMEYLVGWEMSIQGQSSRTMSVAEWMRVVRVADVNFVPFTLG